MGTKDPGNVPLGLLLHTPAVAALDYANERLERRGFGDVRPAHARALRYIGAEGARVGEMAEAAHMTKQSMSSLIAHLEERGYLATEPDARDGRARRVRLTERGLQAQAVVREAHHEIEREWAARLGQEAVDALRTHLTALDALLPHHRQT